MFDVNNILNTTFEDSLSTQSIPVPEGEYVARIEKVEARSVDTKNGLSGLVSLTWVPEDLDGRIKAATGRDKSTVKHDIWLDLTPEGNLDMSPGMNWRIGALRELFGQNTPGKPWSFSMLSGNVARILVVHRTTDKGTFADVKAVSHI